jgi:hypothetical protein
MGQASGVAQAWVAERGPEGRGEETMDNNLIARGNDNQAARSLDDEWDLMSKALAKSRHG